MIRLQKALADRGVASRRHAEELIAAGRVSVDGERVTTLGTRVDPAARIDVDGRPTHAARSRYLALHKPAGVLSTAHDERGRRSVVDVVGAPERLYPVGRLDADSEGLLLLTNDGAWAEHVLHPRYGKEREYEVTVAGDLGPDTIAQLRRGVRLEEGLARAERVDLASRSRSASRLRVVLRTGWKRQIRRMCAGVGLRVTRLVRTRIGTVMLGRLKVGEWRELTSAEVRSLGSVEQGARIRGDAWARTNKDGSGWSESARRGTPRDGVPAARPGGPRRAERVSARGLAPRRPRRASGSRASGSRASGSRASGSRASGSRASGSRA